MMNVLDKIMGEIDKKADYYECGEQGREHIRMVDMVEVEEIIRSHMDEIPCGECSRRKWCQIGYRDGENDVENNGWIPVEERLPEEEEKCIITDKCGYVHDGIIYDYAYNKDENPSFHRWDDEYWECFRPDVIAWRSLPEPYRSEER